MLQIFNTFGRKMEKFEPVNPEVVNIFTCGPSVYQRSHIGNHRTFLFEDVLLRYLEFLGYRVRRGIIFTDVEDKAIIEAAKKGTDVKTITQNNIDAFVKEMHLLRMKMPEYLARASDAVDESVKIIAELLKRGVAYRFHNNIYFDPLQYPRFGTLYGLDMSRWPKKRRRFHKDTYPGMRWNRGDFILWHGCFDAGEVCWETPIGRGRPSWNIQDASVVKKNVKEPLSIYCGGIDNLIRHHDYNMAILESVAPYRMARYWMHCHHLSVEGKKMSKSLGNIYYTETLLNEGYSAEEVRFFLIYGHYRKDLNYSNKSMQTQADMLREFKNILDELSEKSAGGDSNPSEEILTVFTEAMNNDLNVRNAFDGVRGILADKSLTVISPEEASALLSALMRIDSVLQIL
ncbi:MAG: class I tRNA ligase family protein [Syntrophales bacterium]|jgi:cysteinyl-tRNA synthetase|nr:class I tRNA ligase family protein [Syntrophales bacterium]MDY0043589.1 class I tRNA ligase family protein [Syntrophales bacterium]